MAYTKTVWEDLPSEDTPINATALNNIEDGIEDAHTVLGTTSATEIGYVKGVTGAIQTQLNTKLTQAGSIVAALADDTSNNFTPTSQIGMIIITPRAPAYPEIYGIVVYRCTSTAVFTKTMVGGTAFVSSTGALTGTTGTDGKFTMSAHSDGKIYFENRIGTAVSFCFITMGS